MVGRRPTIFIRASSTAFGFLLTVAAPREFLVERTTEGATPDIFCNLSSRKSADLQADCSRIFRPGCPSLRSAAIQHKVPCICVVFLQMETHRPATLDCSSVRRVYFPYPNPNPRQAQNHTKLSTFIGSSMHGWPDFLVREGATLRSE